MTDLEELLEQRLAAATEAADRLEQQAVDARATVRRLQKSLATYTGEPVRNARAARAKDSMPNPETVEKVVSFIKKNGPSVAGDFVEAGLWNHRATVSGFLAALARHGIVERGDVRVRPAELGPGRGQQEYVLAKKK